MAGKGTFRTFPDIFRGRGQTGARAWGVYDVPKKSGFPGFWDLQNLVRGPEISDFRHFSDFSGTLAKTSKSGKSGIFLPPLMETTSPGNLRILSFSDNFLTFLSNLSRDSEIIQVPELSILICPSCDCLDLIMWVKK